MSASIAVSESKQKIIWNIGQKFPQKNLEVSLGASVSFAEFPPETTPLSSDQQERVDETFCVEHNSFCEVGCVHFGCVSQFIHRVLNFHLVDSFQDQ